MKRIVLLILMILFSTISIFAQNRTTIYGNVGVENANIRVLSTQYGTSSDVKGNYSFSIKSDKDIELLYSCIGYQDTTIMIRHKELKKDSVNISFEMRPVYYMLPEVGISGEKVIRYREEKYVMTDFEITNDRFYILQRRNGSLKDYRILLTDMMFNALDTIDIKLNTSVEMMFKDCMNNCHIITADSVYQIVEKGNEYTVAFPTERNKFINVLTSSTRTPKFSSKQWSDTLMSFHKHSPVDSLLALRQCNLYSHYSFSKFEHLVHTHIYA